MKAASPRPVNMGIRAAWCGVARNERGTAILEFALVVIPFFAIMLASLSTSLVFLGQQGLQTAAEAAARIIMTGEAQSSGMTQAQFKAKACASLPPFMQCSNLSVDVQKASTFNATSTSAPAITIDSSGNVGNSFSYAIGGRGDIVIVRLLYLWPMPTVMLGYDLSTVGNGKRLMIATTVAKTEAYS